MSFVAAVLIMLLCPHARAGGDEQDGEREHAQKACARVDAQKFRYVHDDLSKPSGGVAGSKLFHAAYPINNLH